MSVAPRPDEAMPLAADFPEQTHEAWQALAAKVVNRGRPEDRQLTGEQAEQMLTYTTVDGVTIHPLYAKYAGEEIDEIGHPGVMPFTRGTGLRTPDSPWDIRALHDDPDPKVTKDAIMLDLERGVTSIWLEVGDHAVRAGDVAGVLSDVILDLAPVVVSSASDQKAAADALLTVFRERHVSADRAAGRLGYDAFADAARHGTEPDTAPMIEGVRACLAEFPQVRAVTVDMRLYDDAGAGDVDQLGLAVATGIAHVRALVDAGISADDAFSQINFRVTANADQFLTIARLRALRRLWARVGEVCGVREDLRGARQHAVTSRRMISRDDPWVNVLRGTMACFAAAAGGAEAITVLPFDTAAGLPDVLARRIARNTQLLLAEESNVGRVIDPAGGSWYVEDLTDALARAGWEWMQQIEAAGGIGAALSSGLVAERIAATVAERDRRLAARDLPLTGVSSFPNPAEAPVQRRPRPKTPNEGAFPARRDAEMFEALRDASAAAAADGKAPTVPLLCLGKRRDYGARETFATSVLAVAGLAAPQLEGTPAEQAARLREIGSPVAMLCSSPKQYAEHGAEYAAAAREAGVTTLLIAGKAKELGENASAVDGECRVGTDVYALLSDIQAKLGVRSEGATNEGER